MKRLNQQIEQYGYQDRNEQRIAFLDEASSLASLQLSDETMTWFELLASGALAPLDSFMGSADVASVERELQLTSGAFFPAPVTLPIRDASLYQPGQRLTLRDRQNHLLAILMIEEVFQHASSGRNEYALSGPMKVLRTPASLLFPHLRETPANLRIQLEKLGSGPVLAADSWHPLDEPQTAALLQAAAQSHARLLINLMTVHERLDDFELFQRLRLCESQIREVFGEQAILNITGMPKLGLEARDLLLRALIHTNYGADLYLPPAGVIAAFSPEDRLRWESGIEAIGIRPITPTAEHSNPVSGPRPLTAMPSRDTEPGFCLWFTGLPGAGKSTIAEQVVVRLMEKERRVTLLDGDVVRTHLSKGLGFSREDRDTNVQRIGFVASEIVRHGGVAVCAAVSPYRESRGCVREMIRPGAFLEVFVNTPISLCEQRDVKGFYTRARKGTMSAFTGVDDPYEAPEHAEIVLETSHATASEEAERVVRYLVEHGYLEASETPEQPTAQPPQLARQPA